MFRTYCDILPQLSLYRTVYQNIENISNIFFLHLFGISDMNTLKSSDLDQNQRPRATMNSCDAWGVLLSFTRPNRPETMHAKLQPHWQRIHTDTYPAWKIVQRVCLTRWYFHIFHGLDVGFWKVVSRCFKYEPGLPAYTKIILAQRSHCLQQYRRAWSLVSCNVERPWLLDMAAICCNIDG
jgi:hypothetical protein